MFLLRKVINEEALLAEINKEAAVLAKKNSGLKVDDRYTENLSSIKHDLGNNLGSCFGFPDALMSKMSKIKELASEYKELNRFHVNMRFYKTEFSKYNTRAGDTFAVKDFVKLYLIIKKYLKFYQQFVLLADKLKEKINNYFEEPFSGFDIMMEDIRNGSVLKQNLNLFLTILQGEDRPVRKKNVEMQEVVMETKTSLNLMSKYLDVHIEKTPEFMKHEKKKVNIDLDYFILNVIRNLSQNIFDYGAQSDKKAIVIFDYQEGHFKITFANNVRDDLEMDDERLANCREGKGGALKEKNNTERVSTLQGVKDVYKFFKLHDIRGHFGKDFIHNLSQFVKEYLPLKEAVSRWLLKRGFVFTFEIPLAEAPL